jgi:hypothetical protein
VIVNSLSHVLRVIVVADDDQTSVRDSNGVPFEYMSVPLALNTNASWILSVSSASDLLSCVPLHLYELRQV